MRHQQEQVLVVDLTDRVHVAGTANPDRDRRAAALPRVRDLAVLLGRQRRQHLGKRRLGLACVAVQLLREHARRVQQLADA